ncbi:MAG: thioredoxin family protein [Opitutales bacterium]|nr:thioredoxin family protein [Opitutales bacterium]
MRLRDFLILLLTLPLYATAQSKEWHPKGFTIQAELKGYYPPMVFLAKGEERYWVPVTDLPESEQALAREEGEWLNEKPQTWGESTSVMSGLLLDKMCALIDGDLKDIYRSRKLEPEFYLLYFGSKDIGASSMFTPELVKTYKRLRGWKIENFEIVYISRDKSLERFRQSVKERGMPWPCMRYAEGFHGDIAKYAGKGIPSLAVVNRKGEVLFHSYESGRYREPKDIMDSFEKLLRYTNPNNLSFLYTEYLGARAKMMKNTDLVIDDPIPFNMPLGDKDLSQLGVDIIQVEMDLAKDGFVENVEIVTPVPEDVEAALLKESVQWIFIPPYHKGWEEGRYTVLIKTKTNTHQPDTTD